MGDETWLYPGLVDGEDTCPNHENVLLILHPRKLAAYCPVCYVNHRVNGGDP